MANAILGQKLIKVIRDENIITFVLENGFQFSISSKVPVKLEMTKIPLFLLKENKYGNSEI